MKWIENHHVYDCEICGGKAVYLNRRITARRKCEECRFKKLVVDKKEIPKESGKRKCIFCHNLIYDLSKIYCNEKCEHHFQKLSLSEKQKARNQCTEHAT